MKSWIMPVLLAVAFASVGSFAVRQVALAQGAAEVQPMDAGVAEPPAGAATSPAAVSDFNPLEWDWTGIFMLTLTVLGALVGILRVLAPMTKTDRDDWLLGKLEWLSDLLAKIIVPKQYRSGLSLGGGKGGGPVADDNVKFPK